MYKKIICVTCAVALCVTVPFAAIGISGTNTDTEFDQNVSDMDESFGGFADDTFGGFADEYGDGSVDDSFGGFAEDEYELQPLANPGEGGGYAGENFSADEDAEANSDEADNEFGISTFAAVRNPSGNIVYNNFDQFKSGYYTGTDAAKGIDVSAHQGSINWSQVKGEKIDFALIRCGYGNNVEGGKVLRNQDDSQFKNNVNGCRSNGIPFGVYLYSYATNKSMAENEADHVARCLSEAGLSAGSLSLPVYLDIEDNSQSGLSASRFAEIGKAFSDKMASHGYGRVGFYSSQKWFEQKLTDSFFANKYKWIAAWNTTSGLTYSGASNFKNNSMVWQFTNNGRVNGISGRVDLNYTYGFVGTKTPGGLQTSAGVNAVNNGTDSNNPSGVAGGANVTSSTALNGNGVVIASRYNSNYVLDAEDARPYRGSNVTLWTANGGANQRWNISQDSSGYSIIRSAANTSLVLDAADANPRRGSNVSVWTYNGGLNQKWIVTNNSDGSLTIKSAANPDLVLDAADARPYRGSNISVWTSNGGSNQKWNKGTSSGSTNLANTGNSTSSANIVGNNKTLASVYSQNLVMDAQNVRPYRGSNVTLWSANGGANQKWNITQDSNGYLTIVSAANSNLVLDAANPRPWSGCNVTVWTKNGGANQKWTATKNSDGSYTIRNVGNPNVVLDAANAHPWSGCNISVWTSNGGSNQKWVVK